MVVAPVGPGNEWLRPQPGAYRAGAFSALTVAKTFKYACLGLRPQGCHFDVFYGLGRHLSREPNQIGERRRM